ncbi:MAG: alpha/beta fold hydrolase [Chloroflexota bacterium]
MKTFFDTAQEKGIGSMSRFRAGAALILVILGWTVSAPQSLARGRAPHFVGARCPFTPGKGSVAGRTVRCGYLVVPEDRRNPSGPAVRLAVAIFKSPSPAPAPDPIIMLQGGPGVALLQDLGPAVTPDLTSVLAGPRDLILLDQRGTGYSRPLLLCPEFATLKYESLNTNLPAAAQIGENVAAAQRCRARLTAQGIAVGAYSTASDAADVEDVRRALGYRLVNLYGVSYGTRLALAVMHSYPAGVRSVVLDSVVPAQLDTATSGARTIKGAFEALFADCAASRACNGAYPHLAQTFYATAARLDAHPVTLSVTADSDGKTYKVLVTGATLIDITLNSLYQASIIPYVPGMIAGAAAGRYAVLSKVAGTVEFQFDRAISYGMYYSVQCGEEAPFTTVPKITAAVRGLPPTLRSYVLDGAVNDLRVCSTWHVPSVPKAERAPVRSAIPALILSGRYDPVTPPWTGALAARTLSRSYAYTFPGIGHGVFASGPCPESITSAFLAAPDRVPAQAACIATMHGPDFAVPAQP